MAARKRPAAAVLGAGHATTTQGSPTRCKRSRVNNIRSSWEDGSAEPPDTTELLREAGFLEACDRNPYVVGFECLVRDPDNGAYGLVMEYVAAPTLHEFLWKTPPRRCRSPRCAPSCGSSSPVFYFIFSFTAAKKMHDRHVVHRDIKPANILIGQEGELVKICDFGLAISLSELPPYNQAGTAFYLAPELLGKEDYDALVYTWSLGCVMAEMLTGKTLFLGDDDDDDDDDDTNNEIIQLWSIFRLLGTPDDRTWPEFTSLPHTAKALRLLPPGHKENKLRDLFPQEKLSDEGFQVLQGLLTCNPDKRLTADAALKHRWFAAPRRAPAAAKVDALSFPVKKAPRIKFIPPTMQQKNLLKIPVAVWNAAQQV
uniref:[RNA-polymerase]-subunit kinase n=1 Tax=Aegilops tauschii TaxID=37682 RepID=R7WCL2_AEGTA